MGRLILTNDKIWSKKFQDNFVKLLGLNQTVNINSEEILSVFQKKNLKNEIFCKIGGDYVISNGTFL